MSANYRAYVAAARGRVTHDAIVAADTGRAYTECGRILPVGWQEMDHPQTVTTCKACLAAVERRLTARTS